MGGNTKNKHTEHLCIFLSHFKKQSLLTNGKKRKHTNTITSFLCSLRSRVLENLQMVAHMIMKSLCIL